MSKKVGGFLYWTPRLLSVLMLIFLSIFSLDVISEGRSFVEILTGLFMHNIPVLILTAVLIISWKYEIVGGIAFLLAGLFFMARTLFSPGANVLWSLPIAAPLMLIGILFFINWFGKKQKDTAES
ncbi:MAG: hypothetical protein BWY11_01707 [Firmicutes bacterium ADurb.Bin182]|nr:MAG: hypothetical protein BWY11_01707 [Firmicutes bacterium ADurb.Bin182]